MAKKKRSSPQLSSGNIPKAGPRKPQLTTKPLWMRVLRTSFLVLVSILILLAIVVRVVHFISYHHFYAE